ncbi:MAG: 3-hydroxyacyl-CoA dehydrogenase NAD-binding domain-containing protein [Gammaproteobacteria bacterium]
MQQSPAAGIERDGDVAVVVIDNPPVNALAQPVRQGLLAAIEALDADAGVSAIVFHGLGRNFIAGADVREFDGPPLAPNLGDVLQRLENCSKPTIAALHGAVLGGGAELALACRYRCASPDLQFGFPEIKLGLLPGAGGTVRLPRLAGVELALDMMLSGEPIGLESARARGIVDHVIDGEVRAGALAYARAILGLATQASRLRDRPIPGRELLAAEFFSACRSRVPRAARRLAAAERIVECVEAAVSQSFDAALARSRELFDVCRGSGESAALRHLFFAERASVKSSEPARPVVRVGIIGSGTMGCGIATSFVQAGFEVVLVDANAEALAKGVARVHSLIDGAASKGRLSPSAAVAARGRVRAAGELAAVADADLVIEAVFENLAVKKQIFSALGTVCGPETVLATNTSTLDVDEIAAASHRADRVLGLHFFSPANVMRLVELVRARATSPATMATALGAVKRIGKIGVVVGNCFGFVGNRMLYAYGREKELMLLEGATPQNIDDALEAFGMAMGPNAVGDLAGLDIGASARREWRDRPDDPRFFRVSDLLVEHGRLGQKSGRGFYRYDGPQGRRQIDPDVIDLIRAEGVAAGCATARDHSRGNRRALHRCSHRRRRSCSRRRHRHQRIGHRRDLVQRLRLSALAGRPHVLRRFDRARARAGRALSGVCAGYMTMHILGAPTAAPGIARWNRTLPRSVTSFRFSGTRPT